MPDSEVECIIVNQSVDAMAYCAEGLVPHAYVLREWILNEHGANQCTSKL